MLNVRPLYEEWRRRAEDVLAPPRRFRLNLSPYLAPSAAPLRWLGMGLAAALSAAIVWDALELWGLVAEVGQLEGSVARLREQDTRVVESATREGFNVSESANARLASEVGFVNRLVEKRAFSWTRFLGELESAVPEGIGIASVKLDPVGAVVQLSGTAVTFEAVTAFVATLEERQEFREPALKQHRDRDDGLVEFQLTLVYRHHAAKI